MHIAVYNRWLHTRGGGEQHGLALAAVLAERHTVTLITHQAVALADLQAFFGLDLRRLTLAVVPDSPDGRHVQALARQCDGFVNASHTDVIAAPCRHNIMLIFFPASLEPMSNGPAVLADWYAAEEGPQGTFRWSGATSRMVIAPRPQPQSLALGLAAPQPQTMITISSGDHHQQFEVGTTLGWYKFVVPAAATEVVTSAPPFVAPDDNREVGVALYGLSSATAFWRRSDRWRFWADELPHAPRLTSDIIAGYDLLLANSHYTAGWIARRWASASAVLYPGVGGWSEQRLEHHAPTDVSAETGDAPLLVAKQPLILSVGRFFAGGHAKRHEVLIQAFKQLQALVPGWRLALVGGLDEDAPTHVAHLAQLQAASGDAPITLLPNLSPAKLTQLQREASVYWHAGGYGVDVEAAPETVEHFGIAVVEALAAGAVPVVYGAGGPAEIVRPAVDGLHWHTVDDLVAQTHALIGDDERRARLSVAGRERAQDFDAAHFRQRVWELWPAD